MYFSKRESIETFFFRKVMSEGRFHLVLKFLHCADKDQMYSSSKERKLYKIKPVISYLKGKFRIVYIPEHCVDESLLLWKGRLGWKQYIPSKQNQFGMEFLLVKRAGLVVYII
jgi:hypothetical protein